MSKQILIENDAGQTRLALIEDGELAELYIERKGHEKLVGNIYVGRVANILPGMQAAFVDIGLEKNGFLFAGDIQVDKRDFGQDADALERQLSALHIKKMLRPGQEILVQVTKEPGGSKGPRITNNITLPGRLAVLLPTVDYVGISRRIEDEAERARLHALADRIRPDGMGLIMRTAAEGADEQDLARDVNYLVKLWDSIRQHARTSAAPALLHRDLSLINRSVRDMLQNDVERLIVDNAQQYEQARKNAEMLSEAIAQKVTLYEDSEPLFDLYRVDAQAAKALSRRVWLKSGGYLVFDYAEALTVIDVNTGKFVGKHSLSETVFHINCEAACEIARQLRLRDIGGIIVIDFIDMDLPEQREQLIALFRKELKKDRTKTNLVGLTGLGLVEMTRKKIHQPIYKQLQKTCPTCQGGGQIASEETVARAALHELRARTQRGESGAFLVEASAGVVGQLLLIGCAPGIRAFAHVNERMHGDEYAISPAAEHALAPKSRPIPRQ